MKNKPVESVDFGVFGEGGLHPTNFRYVQGGTQYVADSVEAVCGLVENADKVLTNDTRFATMGYENGIDHFKDLALSKKKSVIKIRFKEL